MAANNKDNINENSPFTQSTKMRDLLRINPQLIPVLTRFGIALGFGDSTVAEVCLRDTVNSETFLTVCNFFSGRSYKNSSVDISSLIDYLKSAHKFYLEYVLPTIRTKLLMSISTGSPGDISWMLINFYDKYVVEVKRHMDYEDEKVFKYVASLMKGVRDPDFSILDFEKNHLPIADKLRDIKELLIGHYTAEHARVDILNSVLFDLIVCERDLMMHCALEDKIFVPAVQKLETSINNHNNENNLNNSVREKIQPDSELDEHGDVILTTREKEIICAIAQGLSNKEIAVKLFVSIHTVTTHRRNISNKLNIHSPSGLTIYALMHGLITLEEASVNILQ